LLDKIVDGVLKWLPEDPVVVTRYFYYLQGIILLILIGFVANNMVMFFSGGGYNYLFGGLLCAVFMFMTLFSFKTARQSFKAMKNAKLGITKAVDDISPAQIEEMIQNEKKEEKKEEESKGNYIG